MTFLPAWWHDHTELCACHSWDATAATWSLKEPGSGMKFPVCAVETRRFPVVVSPARPLLQPEATGAVMGTATQGNILSDATTHAS